MRIRAVAAALAALAGCGGEDSPPLDNDQLAGAIENVAEVRPAPKSTPPGSALVPLTRGDIERLPSTGCDFSAAGRLVFAAPGGDALARVNGLLIRFAPNGPVGPSGGFFATERFSISVGRITDSGVTVEGRTSWPARMVLTERGRDDGREELRLEGSWRCSE